jgi:hypothetical protein
MLAADGSPAGDGFRREQRRASGRLALEHGLAAVLGLLVLAVHDVGYLLHVPYWIDESWVAMTTRYPLAQLPATTSSTPIGWSFLLRLVTVGRSQSGRLLPLAFAGAAVVVAYWLGRRLDWRHRDSAVAAGVLAAAGALLAPAMLVRDDLKQYTADACMALVILAVTARLERQWSRRGLVLLSVATWGGMLFSHTAAFAGAAAWGAICLVLLTRRAWRRLAEAVGTAMCTGALALAVYVTFDARAIVPALTAFWQGSFVPVHKGMAASIHFLVHGLHGVRAVLGLGPYWLAVPLVIAGLVTLVRLGRPATAIAYIALWPEMVALSALQKYPYLDERTSTFLLACTVVVAAIGVAGICAAVRARLGGDLGRATAAVLAAAAVLAFGLSARPYLRSHRIPDQDMNGIVAYLVRHAGPHDPIVVSAAANWAFAYYWPVGQPGRFPNSNTLQGYQAYFPGQPRIVVAVQRDPQYIDLAMREALSQVRPGSCARIWLVLVQLSQLETQAYPAEIHHLGLVSRLVEPGLYYVQVGPRSCG